jgi:hypothetical protein
MPPMRRLLRCSKVCELSIAPGLSQWPWVAFSPERGAFAVPVAPRTVAVRAAGSPEREARVELHEALSVPTVAASHSATTSRQPGRHALALHPDGRTVVALGWHRDVPVACVERAGGSPELVDLGPALGDMGPMSAVFARDGESLWLSAENAAECAIVRLRFRDFGLEGKIAFAAPPPPAAHEIFLHPVEDAVLLTMACGQDGTFVRVARAVGGTLELIAGEGDEGLEPCGVAEATEDGSRVCLVGDDRVELRRWPGLHRDAAYEVGDDLSARYNGIRVGGRFVVSAVVEDQEDDDRALVLGDALTLEDDAPAPPGMWAGRLGPDRLVTISRAKGDTRTAYVYSIEV